MSSSDEDYRVVNFSDMEVDGGSNEVFSGRSRALNSLNGQDSFELEEDLLEETETTEERMKENSPFGGSSSSIRHSIEIQNNYDEENAEDQLEAGNGKDIEYDPDGDIYNVSLNEVFDDYSLEGKQEVNEERLGNLDMDSELLNVHMVVYDDPEDGQHLVHWDPAVWNSEGVKEKYEDDDGLTNQRVTDEETDEYIDNDNYDFSAGLSQIEDKLGELSELYLEDAAHASTIEQASKDAWMSQRWNAMSEAISNFRQVQNGKTSQVSFINQSNRRGYS